MAAIANLGTLINIATGGGGTAPVQVPFHKHPFVAGLTPGTLVAGRIWSLWMWDGQPGAATAAPTTAVTVNNATAGSLQQGTPGGGVDLFLAGFVASAHVAGTLVVYDRLAQQGGLSATTTGAQTTNLPTAALSRYTSGVGVEAWLEIYTAIGTTATTVKASYTNTVPASGQTTPQGTNGPTFGSAGFDGAQQILPLGLQSGDLGVKAVASVTITASTLTAGNFGVTLAYPLAVLPMPLPGAASLWSGIMTAGGPLDLGTAADSCIALAWVGNTTTAPYIRGSAYFVYN